MRYYKIIITDPDGNLVTKPSSVPGSGATYTSYANNQSIPGALQVELDVPLKAYATPMKGAMIRIWGISLEEISSASQWNPTVEGGDLRAFGIEIHGGMQRGLPLANPMQAGVIVRGSIFQAFGNWVGTDMTLDIILSPDLGTNALPKNISFDWRANTLLSTAIDTTLKNAFPNIDRNINISDKLVRNYNSPGFYNTLEQFSSYIKEMSASIIGGNYSGVDIFLNNGTFEVEDQTVEKLPKKVQFQDLIGQPTWIEGLTMQFKCVMRSDISIGDLVQMPPAVILTTAAASSSLINLKSAFEGLFYINEIRHVGNFRQPDAASWITTFNGAPQVPAEPPPIRTTMAAQVRDAP